MRIFVTGASGHIGSALVPELLATGHEVVGLARSDVSAAALAAAGAEPWPGSLADTDGLARAAAAADGVIHLAFNHDFDDYEASIGLDLAAVAAMGAALEGSGKPLVNTSGTLVLSMVAPGRTGTEADAAPDDQGLPRMRSENATVAMADRGVRSSVVRLAPTVHSDLDLHGFVPMLVDIARTRGVAAYVGDGANRWPAVHTRDAATLYRLAVESAPAGTRLHGVDDEGVPFRDIAAAIGRHLGVPVEGIAPEEAAGHFGFLGLLVQLDNPTSSARTRNLLGWAPGGAGRPGLLADLDAGHYFAGGTGGA